MLRLLRPLSPTVPMLYTFLLTGLSLMTLSGSARAEEGWVSLFDGKTLDGWVQKNGTAKYTVVDGTIHGETNTGSPNSFLCSEKLYGNFELEFEVKVHDRLNSGVQIRSQTVGGTNEGRVNGPQVEIEAGGEKGAEAGYVYGEATGRGWLTPQERLQPHKHFKDGEWNKFRVVAQGPRIQTWINGQAIEDLTDEAIYKTHAQGFIGLQVHGIGKDQGPYQVQWRNIRLKELPEAVAQEADAKEANAQDSKPEFQTLFDGSSLEGWKHSGNWTIEEGVITRTGKGGSLVYTAAKVPDDFELVFEWKVAEGSNSGVYYRPGQYEYQILHNQKHADGRNPRTSAASLYFCMAPAKDVTAPVGEWNRGRVVCKGSVIQHWLNGEKVIDFDYADAQWKWNVDLLDARGGKLADRGANLSLQDHGDAVWYRNIKIREIPADESIDHTDVQPAEIPADILKAEQEKLEKIIQSRQPKK
ncbi:MAG: DUF1080 domain-containing protein [Planctomycetaceae bacterium]